MSIKRYVSSADSTITNAFRSNLRTRGTGSNMGGSDILEIFSIYGQASSSSLEASRTLFQFPIDQVITDRTAGNLPASGSVNFVLKLFNAVHGETLPKQFTLVASPVSSSWEEGYGLDMEEYKDVTRGGEGVNWINSRSGSTWTTQGGDYLSSPIMSQSFSTGLEDLEIDVTALVELWVSNSIPNYGIGLSLTSSQETQNRSYYTKRFFARTSEFFFKRPILEARWNSSTLDDRQRFFVTSSLLSQADNTHTIYLYNYVAGQLKNIPSVSTGSIFVNIYTSASYGSLIVTTPTPVTGGYVSTGIYSASFSMDTTASIVYDRWFSGSLAYHTGTIRPQTFSALEGRIASKKYITSISNLKPSYSPSEKSRFRLFIREKNSSPNIYTTASDTTENTIIDSAFYKLLRISDNTTIVDYGTGSTNHTKLSYDGNGNFFDFDMTMLESGHTYAFKFIFMLDGKYEEQPDINKFKVQDI